LSGDLAQQTDKKTGKMWNCPFPGLWERTFSVSTSLEFKFFNISGWVWITFLQDIFFLFGLVGLSAVVLQKQIG